VSPARAAAAEGAPTSGSIPRTGPWEAWRCLLCEGVLRLGARLSPSFFCDESPYG
jgi:hypothetical protein